MNTPNENYLDLYFGKGGSLSSDMVEFAGTGAGMIVDSYVGISGERKDRFNNYINQSVIRQGGTYNFETFRRANTGDFTGQDAVIICGKENLYSWKVHQFSGDVMFKGDWTLDLDSNCNPVADTEMNPYA